MFWQTDVALEASQISGIRGDNLITIPLIVINWSISGKEKHFLNWSTTKPTKCHARPAKTKIYGIYGKLKTQAFMQTAKTLIRLGRSMPEEVAMNTHKFMFFFMKKYGKLSLNYHQSPNLAVSQIAQMNGFDFRNFIMETTMVLPSGLRDLIFLVFSAL